MTDPKEAAERIASMAARLEIDHVFQAVDGKMTRVDLPPEEWLSEDYDGISCRNETIKAQDEQLAKARDRLASLSKENARMREALEDCLIAMTCLDQDKTFDEYVTLQDAAIANARSTLNTKETT